MNMKIKIDQLLERMRISYEDEVGDTIDPKSRIRDKVELRVALVNTARPYATHMQLAKMTGKINHTTIVHCLREHDTHMKYSPAYRFNYSIALRVVERFASKYGLLPRIMYTESVNCVQTEIESIERTIEALQSRRDNMMKNLSLQLEV